ncbi:hypothetical protein Tco_0058417 [Tanacetum coccineum]
MDSIAQCMVERASHEQELKMTLKRLIESQVQIQECTVQKVQSSVYKVQNQVLLNSHWTDNGLVGLFSIKTARTPRKRLPRESPGGLVQKDNDASRSDLLLSALWQRVTVELHTSFPEGVDSLWSWRRCPLLISGVSGTTMVKDVSMPMVTAKY